MRFESQELSLGLEAAAEAGERAAGSDDPMTGHYNG